MITPLSPPRARASTSALPRARSVTGAVALGTVLVACTPQIAPAPTPTPSVIADERDPLAQDVAALGALVDELDTVLVELRVRLEAAADGDLTALRSAADLLVAEVGAVTDPRPVTSVGDQPDDADSAPSDTPAGESPTTDGATPDPSASPAVASALAPILPGPDASRQETVAYGDLLTRMLAAARGAGGAGAPVQRFLADPLAGDLGSWQRAPGDLLALIGAAGATGNLDDAASLILALDGEIPRALAWVAHGLATPADASEAASRALAHLAIIDLSFEELS